MLLVSSRWVFVIAGMILSPFLALGAGQKTATVITSNTMTASSQTNKAIFRENVKMVQEDLVVHSDIMIVHFKEKSSLGSSPVGNPPAQKSEKEIRFIEAKSRVKIFQGESRATCQHALYDKQLEKIILRGSPVVWQEGTRVSGQKITMFLNENRSVVEGDTRVTIEESAGNE